MFRRLSEQDFYQVLEVGYDASPEQIQSAYEDAREIYSREALVSASILSEHERRRIVERIADAYQTLIAEESRRLYDERLGIRRKGISRSRISLERCEGIEGSVQAVGTVQVQEAEPPPPRTRVSAEPRRSPLQLGLTEEATGEFLRRSREALGLELGAISDETKIGCSMLEYIETERLDRLPAPVYLRNFTLQIARCLGLEEEKVARTYLSRIRRLQSHS